MQFLSTQLLHFLQTGVGVGVGLGTGEEINTLQIPEKGGHSDSRH